MKPYPTKELQYFVGKICSVFTTRSHRELTAEEACNYFLGVVESIDEYGIFLAQISKGLKVFIMKDQIIAIAEEEVLDPGNSQDAEEIKRSMENMEKMQKQAAELEQSRLLALKKSPFIDAEAMKKIAADLNKNFGELKS